MRKITFGGAISLDNYLARPDHGMDWLLWCDEAAGLMTDYWESIDTILMGRKTYEVALKAGQGGGYGKIKTYVFSTTLREVPAGITLVRERAVEFVRDLKQQSGKGILLMGGGEFARPLFEAGLIDELGYNIHPVLLGSGVPLYYSMGRQTDLELLECRPFRNGCVYVKYRVKPAG